MSDHSDQHEAYRQRLLDRALHELLSDDAPPDLTETILSASSSQEERHVSRRTRNFGAPTVWFLGVTSAACVVMLAGWWLPRGWQRSQQSLTQAESALDHSARFEAGQAQMHDATLPQDEVAPPEQWMADDGSGFAVITGGVVDLPDSSDAGQGNSSESPRILAAHSVRSSGQNESRPAANPEPADDFGLAMEGGYGGYAGGAGSDGDAPLGSMGGGLAGGGYGGGGGGYGGGGYGRSGNGVDADSYGGGVAFGGMPAQPGSGDGAQPATQPGGEVQRFGLPESESSLALAPTQKWRRWGASVDDAGARRAKSYAEQVVKQPATRADRYSYFYSQDPASESGARGASRQLDAELKQVTDELATLSEELRTSSEARQDGRSAEKVVARLAKLQQAYKRLANEQQSAERADHGRGGNASGDQYTRIYENPFVTASGTDAVSTFSIDVDTASYANTRQFLMQQAQLPPADAVRLEELVNYFAYSYEPPQDDRPFAASMEVASCPWQPEHRLVRIGIQGQVIGRDQRPASNLVFLVDVSGSMDDPNKLPLVVAGLKQLTQSLSGRDRVAIVVYANREGLVLPSTAGSEKAAILATLHNLKAGGSTAGGAGIQLAYQIAEEHFVSGGTNRVILCTDGDFNVGVTNTADLERMAEEKAKSGVFLTVLGFGRGNLNDAMMEQISNKGNGNYHYVDNETEAHKVLVREMSGTLVTIAKDVKIQVEFNPARVASYRLLGYENRLLAREDFENDAKDAGEIGAGHSVTALYQIVPAGEQKERAAGASLKYQQDAQPLEGVDGSALGNELMELRIRYKDPEAAVSQLLKFPLVDAGKRFAQASHDFRFAASVVSFGMLLRDSEHRGEANVDAVIEMARGGAEHDEFGYRAEFIEMIERAKQLGLP